VNLELDQRKLDQRWRK